MHKSFIFVLFSALTLYMPSCKSADNEELGHHHHHHHNHEEHATEHDHEGHDEGEHEHEHANGNEGEITLSPEMADRFGVATETAAFSPFGDALKVSGEIVASPSDAAIIAAPTAGILNYTAGIDRGTKVTAGRPIAKITASGISGGDRNLAAQVALDAAKRELDRLTPLYNERLVTASDYNAAVKAYEEAKASYSASAQSGAVVSPISGTIVSIDAVKGQYVEVGAPIASVSSSARLTLRADVPQRYMSRVASFTDAVVSIPYTDKTVQVSALNGQRTASGQSDASATPGYIPVYFTLDNDGSFVAGSNVEIYLRSAEDGNVISVPTTALSEQQGLYYVFVRLDEDCYRKVLVQTGRSNGERVEILSGLNPGDNVVVAGTTTVRIAESSGTVPEGHSHNH